jgi:predicted patatin/cPLA2 family phospholipase
MPTLYDELLAHKNNPNDKRVFGLVIQGGGMRGVYSCGAVTTLLGYGFGSTFEHVIGSSAGALNGAYFLSADKDASDIYTERLTNKNFVDLLRVNKIVDIDYLVDNVLRQQQPVNIHHLKSNASKLNIVVTNARNGRKEVLSTFAEINELYEEFRATAALPMLYDKEVKIKDKWYVDGGVADLIPVDVAHELGCTDIVVILTKQIASYSFDKKHSRLVKHLIKHFAKDKPQPLRLKLPTNEKLLKLNLRHLTHPFKNTRVYVLEPSDEEVLITLATIDKPKVAELAELGVKDMDRFLQKAIEI